MNKQLLDRYIALLEKKEMVIQEIDELENNDIKLVICSEPKRFKYYKTCDFPDDLRKEVLRRKKLELVEIESELIGLGWQENDK